MSMSATVDAKDFSSALDKVGRLLKRSAVPALEEVRVDCHGDKCVLTATDLTAWLTVELSAKGDSFSFVFSNTKNTMKACRYYDGELQLVLSGDEKRQVIAMRCGDKTAELVVIPAEDYPDVPTVEPLHSSRTDAATLLERVDRVKYASLQAEQRPWLGGVRFEGTRIWCVDGYRLAVNEDDGLRVEAPFLLPVSSLAMLKAFGKSEVKISVGKGYALLTGNGVSLYSRLLFPGDSIRLETALPKQSRESYTANRKQYITALKYLGEFAKLSPRTPVRFTGGSLHLCTPFANYSAMLELDGECEIEYGFDLRYMKEALEQFPDAQYVTISASGPLSPVVLTDGGKNTALVLTVRMKEEQRRTAA